MKICKKIPVFLILFFTFNAVIYAQIIAENTSETGNFTLGGVRGAPVTVSHTVAGVARVLYVGISNHRVPPAPGTPCVVPLPATGSVVGVTYNAMPLERLTTQTTNLNAVISPDFCNSVEVFRLVNPPAGTADVSVSQPTGGDYLVVGAVSFSGVDGTTSASGAIVPTTGDSAAPSVTVTTAANNAVLDVLAVDFNAGIATPLQTELWNGENFFGSLRTIGAGSAKPATGASTTTNWTLNAAGDWALAGIRLVNLPFTGSPSAIGGQIRRTDGEPLPDTLVILQNLQSGEQFYFQTGAKGRYLFENLEIGQTYRVTVFNYKYAFAPAEQVVSLLDSIDNLDFAGSVRTRNWSLKEAADF